MIQPLTQQQKNFIEKYFRSGKLTESAIAAGYKPSSAKTTASRVLSQPNARQFLMRLQSGSSQRAEVSVAWVLAQLKRIAEVCAAENELEDENGKIKKILTDARNANQALHLIGQHLKMFTEKIEVGATEELAERLSRAFARTGSQDDAG